MMLMPSLIARSSKTSRRLPGRTVSRISREHIVEKRTYRRSEHAVGRAANVRNENWGDRRAGFPNRTGELAGAVTNVTYSSVNLRNGGRKRNLVKANAAVSGQPACLALTPFSTNRLRSQTRINATARNRLPVVGTLRLDRDPADHILSAPSGLTPIKDKGSRGRADHRSF